MPRAPTLTVQACADKLVALRGERHSLANGHGKLHTHFKPLHRAP